MKSMKERLEDPNNINPLFHRISNLANIHLAGMTKKLAQTRSTIFPLIGGGVLAEILEREPNPRKMKSKSERKYLLGVYGGNMECWSSPSSRKFVLVTNGLRGKKREVFELIPVRKIQGVWCEYEEVIKP